MISPLKPANRISTDWVVCDIENRSNGDVLAIDTYDGKQHHTCKDWSEWYEWIKRTAYLRKEFRTIYAHNGGKWDWLSFIEWVITDNPEIQFHTIENGGRIVSIIIPVRKGLTIKLCDSLCLLNSSLEDAAQKYTGKGKVRLDYLPEWYYDNQRSRFWDYLYRDTETLFATLTAFGRLVFEKIAPIQQMGITLPSLSLRAFKTAYLGREISIPQSENLKIALRNAYCGGRVEVFRSGYFPQINVYDINSLYPSVMYDTPVPDTGTATRTQSFDPDVCGVYHVRFSQGDRNKKPLLMVGGLGQYEGEGWYFTNELARLMRMAKGKLSVLDGYRFDSQSVLFRQYIEKLYALRMQDPKGPLGNTCKLCMNSLYGKFGQKPERTVTRMASIDDVQKAVSMGIKVTPKCPDVGIYSFAEEHEAQYEHVGIAGTITSEARARLWESIDANTIYVDTDSVHTLGSVCGTIDSGLGKWKLEYSGEGVYVGKKLYAIRKEGIEKVRAKGVRVGGENGFPLSFDALRSTLDGSSVQTVFRAATTANDVLRGKKSCIFQERKRRIRKTAKS